MTQREPLLRRRGVESDETKRMRSWNRKLYDLFTEMEKVNGDPPAGINGPDYETLTRLAWQESNRELDLLCKRDGVDRWTA